MFQLDLFLQAIFSAPLFKGALLTIGLSLCVMAVSLVLGMALGSMAGSPRRSARWLATLYVWLFRGAPALLVLLFVWNGLPQISEIFRAGWFTPFFAAFLALSLIQIAYLAEILRSAFAAVGHGQREGAAALGMHRWQIFLVITMPQALRIAVPALMNEFISLLKTTSLATVISLKELMTVSQFAIATSFRFLEWYGAALVYYLVIVSVLTLAQNRIEHVLSRGYR
ncbi:amino acid ABC transporter permease [Sinorhizobium meliloti]|uniref:amino acid ABC transporter permease n=1 Tax=Rhizobium meliloti TaxID=382 RepID=UPI0002DFBFE3|nr:amino acid ABC transporter permease [Sinorhizobium meliloti]MDE3876083.1 amino acid ABC transporter permease [Sinorhizobium meliloti]MDW9390532.1 ABC transporter permease subunit [Sinorhizobium meliloti]MDW9435195.1 ABC transporter permease subunit [Sinorhizobium meliloti]MDW9481069.1 ABC transporter permease subunit [Sinorhizobium meliloti]MDW9548215.1 ABC transporter permease subunit [Sinorhizobium meliloti]